MRLRLHEELLLLALHDRKGTNAFAAMLDQGLAGALLAELLLDERVEIRAEGKRGLVTVIDPRPLGDPVLDEALARLRDARRRADPQAAVGRLAKIKELRHKTARTLCRRGVLRESEDQILLLFRRRVYPTVDPGPERDLIQRIRSVLEGGSDPDPRTLTLISLADSTRALSAIFDRKELKSLKSRIEALRARSDVAEATQSAIQAIETAVFVTTIAAT